MSKRLWCGVYAVSVSLLIILMIAAAVVGMLTADEILQPGYLGLSISLLVLGYLQFIVVHTVVTLVLLFTMWKALEDGVTPVTAGKAIGFLFIPFFNIYWFFRVWGGYPAEYNKFLARHQLSAPPLSSGTFIAFAITVGLSAVLVIPILILPFVTIFLIARGCDAVTNLEIARSAAAARRAPSPAEFIGTPENPRSKIPAISLAGVAALAALVMAGFGVFVWLNLHPKASADVVPETVGDFKMQLPGRVDGSFFGRKLSSMDNIYVSETGGNREAIRYNIFQYSSESLAVNRVNSFCSSGTTKAAVIKDQQGAEAGHFCVDSGSATMQVGRYFLWAHGASGYDLERAKAKEASMNSVVAFVKALPLAKNLSFPDTNVTTAPTTTTSTQKTSVVLSNTTPADFSVTAQEFYDETNGGSPAAKAKYKGKTVQISSRVELPSGSSLMMSAGKSSIFANYEPTESASFSKLERDERVVVKCIVEAEYSIRLNGCVLVENKGIISPTDVPDVTFTADEYWKAVASFDVPVDAKIKKQDELKGKIIKITGKVKDLAGTKYYIAAGNDNEFPCYPDDKDKPTFEALTEGQPITVLAVGGTSLSHCLVVSN